MKRGGTNFFSDKKDGFEIILELKLVQIYDKIGRIT